MTNLESELVEFVLRHTPGHVNRPMAYDEVSEAAGIHPAFAYAALRVLSHAGRVQEASVLMPTKKNPGVLRFRTVYFKPPEASGSPVVARSAPPEGHGMGNGIGLPGGQS